MINLKSVNRLVIRAIIEFVVLASILSLIGYSAYYKLETSLKASLEEAVALQAKSIAVGLNNQFNEKFHKLRAAAYIAESGQVAIENIDEVFMVGTKGESLGIVTKDNKAIIGYPLPQILVERFQKVFEGEQVVKYHNSLGLIFAVPVKVDGETCLLYNAISSKAVKTIFNAVSYNGDGTVILLNSMDDWMVISDGAELINTDARMRPNWLALSDKARANESADSWSLYGKYRDKGYFLYLAWISREHNFAISGYAPWRAVAVGIDYVYMIMYVVFIVMMLALLFLVRSLMKSREAEYLEHEKAVADSANKAKSEFLSNMSHEIRTPINAIMGMDEMILRESKDESILEYAENLQNAARNLLGIVNDILDFSKIEAGKMEIIPVEYHISSMLNDLANMISTRAKKKGLEFKINASQDMPSVLYGDEIRIKQIITNILTNAVKYTETGSVTLNVNTRALGEENVYLCISVSDTGIGIKKEDIGKLFSAFERIEEKRNRTIEGTGLGINITQKLLHLMNSKLEVSSVYGEGSTFSFALEQKVVNHEPIGDFEKTFKHSLKQHQEYHEKFTAPKAKVLVVDDTVMNLTVVKGLLKQTKIQIDTCESGYDCLKLVAKNKYDIIFLDHRMPGMDGIETLREIQLMTPNPNRHTPVISLTANAISGAREQYIAAGFKDYLTKPINSTHLENLIIKYLPEDKVNKTSADVETESVEAVNLPEWLTQVEGLNTAEGVEHCGDVDLYMEALTVFAQSVETGADEIERYYKAEDWKNYTTKVHALKSSSRVIGALELSERAKRLEDAGNSGYTNEIKQDTEPLLKLYRSYSSKLQPLIQTESDDIDKPLIDENELMEAYEAMREIAASFDYDSLQFVMQSLDEYKLPDEEAKRYKQIKEAAAKLDWESINKLLN